MAPPGITPSATGVPTIALRASLMVPSPENTTIMSNWSSTALWASSVACPRSLVSHTSSLKSAERAFSMTSSTGRDTVRATGFTTNSTRSGLR